MKTSTTIRLDKWVARPLAALLNIIARPLGKLLRIDHSMDKDFDVIAVCKFKGMGSILQATPMLAALRKRFPAATIVFVSTESNRAILEKIPAIDRIETIDDKGFWRFCITNAITLFRLIKLRPGVYFDLEIYSNYSSLFTTFTLSKNRVGYYIRSGDYRRGIYTHLMFFNSRLPLGRVYMQMAGLLHCEAENDLLNLKPEGNALIPHPYIAINPNASDLRLERRWSADSFVDLIGMLSQSFPQHRLVLLGNAAEKPYTEGIAKKAANDRLVSMAGKTTLSELINVISGADCVVTNDTGPMHLAFCTRTPVVCLFGPASPGHYMMGDVSEVIYKSTYCSPCVHDFEVPPCHGDNVCMKLIRPQEVHEAVVKLMENRPRDFGFENTAVYRTEKKVLGLINRNESR